MRKKSLVFIMMIFVLSCCILGNVYAAENTCKLNISASSNEIKAGETLTLNLNVTDLSMEDNENLIFGVQGIVEYDDKIFKDVKVTSTKLKECSFQNNIFIANSSDLAEGVKKGESMITITLTAKNDIRSAETLIELNNITVSNVKGIGIEGLKSSIKINVIGDKVTEDEENKADEKNQVTNNTQTGNKTNTNTNSEKIPYVGPHDFAIYGIITIIAFGVVCYIKYKRLSGIK